MDKKTINLDNSIPILNPKQAAFYWGEKGIEPVCIYPSIENKTEQHVIVFVFNRQDTYEAYREWQDRKRVNL